MSYTQFNGQNIIPMPSTPAFKTLTLSMNDSVGMTQSPFTMQSQVQAWPGADWWEAEIALPPMTRAQAAPWMAWLGAVRGKAAVFQIYDPLFYSTSLGLGKAGTNNGVNAALLSNTLATATTISTNGWIANAQNVLLPGDRFSLGYRLHQVVSSGPVNADSNGNASFDIWPSVRENQNSGMGIYFQYTYGLFRLAENKRVWSATESKLYGISFKAVEAR